MLPIHQRKGILGATFCLAFLALVFSEASDSPLRVLADDNYPPYSFRDSSGELQGIVVDQWRAWERATGKRVDLVGMEWSEALRRMRAGEADVLDTMFDTPDRRALYEIGPPYAKIESSVFFHKTISGIAKLSDLKGFRVAVKSGDSLVGVLQAEGVADFAYYPNYEDIVRAAAMGDIKVFCIDRIPALYFLNKFDIENDFRYSVAIPGGEFHRAARKGRTDVLSALKSGFDAIPRSTYAAIDRKWFGAEISHYFRLQTIAIAAAIAICIFLFLLIIDSGLRRRIAAATVQLRQRLEELEASQAKNRAFIAALPDLFFTLDRDGRYLEYNAASMDLLIRPPEMFLGKLASDLDLGPGLAERLVDSIRTAIAEKRLVIMEYDATIGTELRRFEGRFVPLDAERAVLVARDITDERKQEVLLRASLEEKEILLREVHHRVKNNLQVISSLISLQESACRDDADRELNKDTQARVRSMAYLHELLYGSKDLSSIDPAEYIKAIVDEMSGYYGKSLIRVEAQSDVLSMDEAMPFGLIVTELMTNALKYAYRPDDIGNILVSYSRSVTERRLEVRDAGVGLPPGFDFAASTSLGFTLIRSLSEQIGGKLSLRETNPGESRPGLCVVLVFPSFPQA
jgi:two-component sensor histidine kinase/ABC-type amino acid transport substrate-binding protein